MDDEQVSLPFRMLGGKQGDEISRARSVDAVIDDRDIGEIMSETASYRLCGVLRAGTDGGAVADTHDGRTWMIDEAAKRYSYTSEPPSSQAIRYHTGHLGDYVGDDDADGKWKWHKSLAF